MREGRWHQATKDKTTYEIKRYLVEYFSERALEGSHRLLTSRVANVNEK